MKTVFYHLLFWAFFLVLWNRLMYFYVNNRANSLYFTAVDVSLIIVTFYLVYNYVMPSYFKHKNIYVLVFSCLMIVLFIGCIYAGLSQLLLAYQLIPIKFDFSWNYIDLTFNRFFVALLGVFGACSLMLAKDRLTVSKRIAQVEKEKSLAELSLLKAQINPHFLFNSLNTLYAQLEINAEGAKDTLTAIADLLRYQLYECNVDQIEVKQEITYLQNYFSLQKLRKDNCDASLSINGSYEQLKIAPLLLIPFVENAFKYLSDWDDKRNTVNIEINSSGNSLQFLCENTTENLPDIDQVVKNDQSGIGLMNVKKRLELLYENRYSLVIKSTHNNYTVNLNIEL